MNCLQKLCFRGGKYSYLLLLLFLWLGNSGVWAQDEPTLITEFNSNELVTSSTYASTYGGDDWFISIGGNNKSLGFNNKNCKSIDDNLGTDAVKTNYGVVVKSKKMLSGVNRITFLYTGGSGDGGKIYLASSKDNVNWTAIELKKGDGLSAQGTALSQNTELTFEFENNDDAYYGIILDSGAAKTAAYRFDNVVIKFFNVATASTTEPSINIVNEVTFNAEDEEGEIPYIIDSPVENSEGLNASIVDDNVDWIIVDVTSDKLMLVMEQNTGSEPRTAQIKLEYEGAETKYVTVTQLAPVVKYTVLINEPINGTLTVTYGEGIFIDSIDELPDGTELTITATPNSGYKLVKWEATGDDNVVLYTSTEASGTYTVNSDVTFTAEFTEIPSYEVTIEAPENGTLTVMKDDEEVATGAKFAEGTVLTVKAEPAQGYKLTELQAIDNNGITPYETGEGTYTIGESNVTFKATFDEIVSYTVTWSVNGVETTEEVEEGTEIKFIAPTENIPTDYVFMGWSVSTIDGTQDDAPEFVKSATINSDVTYYAVFAKAEGAVPSLVKMTMDDDFADGDKIVVVANVDETTAYGLYQETISNSYVKNFEFENDVDDVASDDKKWWTITTATDGKWKLGDAKNGYLNNSSSNNLNVDLDDYTEWFLRKNEGEGNFSISSTLDSKKYISCRSDLSGTNQYRYRMAGGTPGGIYKFDIYKYTGGSVVYSDYCTSVSTDPYIEANDVTYAAYETSGEITYIIKYPTDQTLNASSETPWISDVVVDTENGKVTFTMTENEKTSQRVGTITLTYGKVSKGVTVTQGAAVAKYKVTIKTSEKGTLTVMNGDKEITDGTMVSAGTELTIKVTPNDGYKLVNWKAIVGDVEEEKTETSGTYIVKDNVTFEAIFDEIVYYTITWSINGIETTEDVEEGKEIEFNTPTENIPEGYVFKGWYDNTLEPQDNAPEYVTSATATADVTYYAVFAKGKSSEPSLVKMTMNDDIIEGDKVVIVASVDETTAYGLYQETIGGSYVKNFVFTNNVEDVALDDKKWWTVSDGTSADDGKWKLGDEINGYLNNSGSNNLNVDVSGTSEWTLEKDETNGLFRIKGGSTNRYLSCRSDLSGDNQYRYRMAGSTPVGIYSFDIYKYVSGSIVYSDFRTSVTAPTTATITIAKACTNGEGTYYGTYSCGKAFVVPDDLIVSEISVIDKKLLVESYSTGAVVPANTGVMISAIEPGEYTVELSDETGTSVLGSDNMLYASGDNGITAEEMGDAHPDCIYYRLTMHKKVTLGYYWGAADGAAFALAANKAYLAVPTETAAKISGFNIGGGETTGIAGVETDGAKNGAHKIYNLQGQRVSEPLASGLYIIDGRKVVVK